LGLSSTCLTTSCLNSPAARSRLERPCVACRVLLGLYVRST
jgi:hypothetical protein